MSIGILQKNKKKSFLWFVCNQQAANPYEVGKNMGWSRQRVHAHMKQAGVFPRTELAALAHVLGMSYYQLCNLEATFWAPRQVLPKLTQKT